MSIYAIYFSPTHSTETIVKMVANEFGKYTTIDLSMKDSNYNLKFDGSDLCIVGVPSYGGRVPQVAMERLRCFQSNGAKAILITSYGNRDYDDTLLELQDAFVSMRFECIAAMAIVAEHSIMHQYATHRPNEEDLEQLKEFAHRIQKKNEVKNGIVPGKRPYKKYNGIPLKPKANASCIACGLCAKECPVGAIPLDQPIKTDNKVCISCMRCIQVCPVQARHVNSLLVTVASLAMKKVCDVRKENELFL